MNDRTHVIRKSTTYILGQGQKDMHKPTGVHETIPDQTLSLRQLVERHTRGLSVPQFKPVYSDMEIPDIHKMDLAERDQYIEAARQNTADIQRELRNSEEKRKNADIAQKQADTSAAQ